jgi:hypothetical protein
MGHAHVMCEARPHIGGGVDTQLRTGSDGNAPVRRTAPSIWFKGRAGSFNQHANEPAQFPRVEGRLLAQTDHLGIHALLHQISGLFVWGVAVVVVLCFAISVWNVYVNARGHAKSWSPPDG